MAEPNIKNAVRYGYMLGKDGKVRRNPEEQKVIKRILSLKNSKTKVLTNKEIAETLNTEKLFRKGKQWKERGIREVLKYKEDEKNYMEKKNGPTKEHVPKKKPEGKITREYVMDAVKILLEDAAYDNFIKDCVERGQYKKTFETEHKLLKAEVNELKLEKIELQKEMVVLEEENSQMKLQHEKDKETIAKEKEVLMTELKVQELEINKNKAMIDNQQSFIKKLDNIIDNSYAAFKKAYTTENDFLNEKTKRIEQINILYDICIHTIQHFSTLYDTLKDNIASVKEFHRSELERENKREQEYFKMVKLHNKKVSGLKKDIDTYLSFFSKHQDKKVLLEIKDKYLTKCTNDDQCSCSDCRYLSSLHVPTISYVEKPMTEFTIDSIPTSDINQLSRKDALNLDAFFTKANSIIAKDSNMSKVMTEIYENPKKYPAAYKYFETYYLKNKDIEIFVSCKSLDYVQNKYPYSVNSHLYQLDNFTVNQVLENFRKSEYYDFATMSKERREKVNAIRDLGF